MFANSCPTILQTVCPALTSFQFSLLFKKNARIRTVYWITLPTILTHSHTHTYSFQKVCKKLLTALRIIPNQYYVLHDWAWLTSPPSLCLPPPSPYSNLAGLSPSFQALSNSYSRAFTATVPFVPTLFPPTSIWATPLILQVSGSMSSPQRWVHPF